MNIFVDLKDFNTCGFYFSILDYLNHDVSTSLDDDYDDCDERSRLIFFDDLVQVGCSPQHAICDRVFLYLFHVQAMRFVNTGRAG